MPTSFIHTGVYDVLRVDRLSSVRMQNHATLVIAFLADNSVNLIVPELALAIIKLVGGIAAALGISSAIDKNRRPLG